MKERHWNNVVTGLRHAQCVLVLGPEIPTASEAGDNSGKPCADELRDHLTKELQDDGHAVAASSSLAGVAQQYEDTEGFGAGTLRSQSAAFYDGRVFRPSGVHRQLAALPFALVLSTSHDSLLAEAFAEAGKQPVGHRYHFRGDRQDNPELKLAGTPGSPCIFHLFGVPDEPQSMVLGENDLMDFLLAVVGGNPPLPTSLQRLLQRNGTSFLFAGFGIRHWYLRVLLKVLVRGLSIGGTGGTSVAVEPLLPWIPEPERQQTVLFYHRGTRIEVCDQDLTSFLSELQRRFEAAGGLSDKAAHVLARRPSVFVSYASEDRLLAARLFTALQEAGFDPWFDKEALRGGDDWDSRIEDELREVDYVLVLQTAALADKTIGYVNKEIRIARDQALRYRGLAYLIPLRADDLPPGERISELSGYQELALRSASFKDDVAALVSTLRRDFQRRAARG